MTAKLPKVAGILIILFAFIPLKIAAKSFENSPLTLIKNIFIYQIETNSFIKSDILLHQHRIISQGPMLESPLLSRIVDGSNQYITPSAIAPRLSDTSLNHYFQQMLLLFQQGSIPTLLFQNLFPKLSLNFINQSIVSQTRLLNSLSGEHWGSGKHLVHKDQSFQEIQESYQDILLVIHNISNIINTDAPNKNSFINANTDYRSYDGLIQNAYTIWGSNPFKDQSNISNIILKGKLLLKL